MRVSATRFTLRMCGLIVTPPAHAPAISRPSASLKPWVSAMLCAIILLAACYGSDRSRVQFTFENNTDALLCLFPSSADAAWARLCDEVKPRKDSVLAAPCGEPAVKDDPTPITVVLTVGLGGEVIYTRMAPCNEWNASGAKITIDEQDGQFVVTDSLPEDASSR